MKKNLLVALLLLSGSTVPVFAQRYTFFPHFASGGGWSSEVSLANQGLSAVSGIVVSFYDDNGAPLTVDTNLGSSAALAASLNPGATQVIRISAGTSTAVGYIVIRYPSSLTPVTATEVFRYEEGGTVLAEVGVPQQVADNNFSFPVEVNSYAGITTAAAFANPTFDSTNAQAQTLVVDLINSDGTIQQTATVPLAVGQHTSLYINQAPLFPGLEYFTGSISISSPTRVGVLALRQDKQAFGAISTDSGPLLGPFAVSGTAISEIEPNGSTSGAQQLLNPALVAGFIGSIPDYDFFRFTGRRGDIVSVICDTQGLNSALDSVLFITKSDGSTVIAVNDQNGLYNQNDSFLQIVLPDDGTYYIVVTDYYGYGGTAYPYRLHFKLFANSTP